MTQIFKAKQGKITKEIKAVAQSEQISVDKLIELIAHGRVVITANKNHQRLKPIGIGQGLRTKINANIGASPGHCDLKTELKKLRICEKYEADAVMDLSVAGDLDQFRRMMLKKTSLPLGTVPIYQVVVEMDQAGKGPGVLHFTAEKCFEVIEKQAEDGVSFMTIHAGFKREFLPLVEKRVIGIVSRGGGFLEKWMRHHGKENPFYENFDRILEIARKYDITLSLGDALRPGSIADAGDQAQLAELKILGELTLRCWKAGVQVMIEGPGHVPVHKIKEQMELEKKICFGAPFYVLGPLVTDVGAGYDHITAAIGGALAATYGADFLCYVTPAEHLRLPSLNDVKEGIIASKIAAHAADLAKGIPGAKERDLKMSKLRKALNWEEQQKLVFDPEKFIRYRRGVKIKGTVCTMCGKYCPMKSLKI